jgi:hypothetical protein
MPKKRFYFTDEQKQKAVEAYVSGRRRADEIANEIYLCPKETDACLSYCCPTYLRAGLITFA